MTSFFHDTNLQGKDITRIVCTGCALKNFQNSIIQKKKKEN